jgi:hypothetical protein
MKMVGYIKSCHCPVEWITLILFHAKYRIIPTYKVTKEICEETEKGGLVLGLAHAEWCGLLDDSGLWIVDFLSISGAISGNISKIRIGEFGVE